VRLHTTVVDAAVAAGVERIVDTSFLGAPVSIFTFGRDHWHTEQQIRAAGVRHTFLRDCLYRRAYRHLPGETLEQVYASRASYGAGRSPAG
jgi:NAD(P)H dehydrogenase (quinone)